MSSRALSEKRRRKVERKLRKAVLRLRADGISRLRLIDLVTRTYDARPPTVGDLVAGALRAKPRAAEILTQNNGLLERLQRRQDLRPRA